MATSAIPDDVIFRILSLVDEASPVEDRLTSLPDDVIVSEILPLLSVKDAAKMSSLSTQWMRLCSVSDLNLRDSDLISRSAVAKISTLSKNQQRCVEIIDRILTAEPSPFRSIHSFTLSRFFLPHLDPATLVRWFEIINEKGIQRLSLRSYGFPRYSLPPCPLFNSPTLVELDLGFCQFVSSVALPRLRILSLKHTLVADECLDGMISDCPVLEIVKMRYCRGFKRIRIRSNSLRTLDLKIASSSSEIMEIVIEIAPNLEKLILCGNVNKMVSVRVLHAPKLH